MQISWKNRQYFSLYVRVVQFAGGLGFVESYVCYFQLLPALERILTLCSISIIFIGNVMPPGQGKNLLSECTVFRGLALRKFRYKQPDVAFVLIKVSDAPKARHGLFTFLFINCQFTYTTTKNDSKKKMYCNSYLKRTANNDNSLCFRICF